VEGKEDRRRFVEEVVKKVHTPALGDLNAEVVGEKPRPRALILGFDAETTSKLEALFPTAREVSSVTEVRQAEWDLLVTRGGVQEDTWGHLYVVGIGGDRYGQPSDLQDEGLWSASEIVRFDKTLATVFAIPGDLPQSVARLVKEDLLPSAQKAASHATLVVGINEYNWKSVEEEILRPFLMAADGRVIAASFIRKVGQAECWCLPAYADPVAWTKAALEEWHKKDENRFPRGPDWNRQARWQTPAEHVAEEAVKEISARRKLVLAELDTAEHAAREKLEAAREKADQGPRRLLTERGDGLVDAVSTALTHLGFSVENMDLVFPENDRLEDLRVTATEFSGWVAIVEVKAYAGGAKVNDLMRLQRYSKRFIRDKGKLPDAMWYVVNQFVGRDPSERPQILASNKEELATFASDSGLAMDTTTLFDLWVAVQKGVRQTEEVRETLARARGRVP
jgi:hypothetical protein